MTLLAAAALLGLITNAESAIDLHVGRGPTVQSGDRYTITYTVTVLGGKEIANSTLRGLPYSKELGDGHDGYFDTWVRGMSVGGERRLVIGAAEIPAALGEVLPGREDLVVQLRLVAIKPGHGR